MSVCAAKTNKSVKLVIWSLIRPFPFVNRAAEWAHKEFPQKRTSALSETANSIVIWNLSSRWEAPTMTWVDLNEWCSETTETELLCALQRPEKLPFRRQTTLRSALSVWSCLTVNYSTSDSENFFCIQTGTQLLGINFRHLCLLSHESTLLQLDWNPGGDHGRSSLLRGGAAMEAMKSSGKPFETHKSPQKSAPQITGCPTPKTSEASSGVWQRSYLKHFPWHLAAPVRLLRETRCCWFVQYSPNQPLRALSSPAPWQFRVRVAGVLPPKHTLEPSLLQFVSRQKFF